MFRRCLFIAFWLVVGLYVVHQPEAAAHTATVLMHGLADTAGALARFASAL